MNSDCSEGNLNAWLQHDAMHPGCHFDIMMQTNRTVPVREMVESLKIYPELTIEEIFIRKTRN